MKAMMSALVLVPLMLTAEVGFANVPTNTNASTEIAAGTTEIQTVRPRHRRPGRRCHAGWVRRCNNIRTPIGIVIRQCRNVWSSCARRGGWGNGGWNGGWNVASVDQATQTIAEKYNLSYEDADAMVTAIDEAKEGNASTLNALSAELELDQTEVDNMTADLQ